AARRRAVTRRHRELAAPRDGIPLRRLMALLEIRGLIKRFIGVTAVDRVDLAVERGELVSLIGPNGSGKTTLFNCVTGYVAADGGQVLFRGRDLTNAPCHRVARLGIARTFQQVSVFPRLSVLDNLLVFLQQHQEERLLARLLRTRRLRRLEVDAIERARGLLELVGLAHRADAAAGSAEIEVLRGVSLAVRTGEIVCIIGANGAGKSTLLRTVFGMVPARAGTIRFAGEEIANRLPTEVLKRGVGYVPQGRCNFPAMSVEENLEMGAYLRRDAAVPRDIAASLERFPVLAARRRDLAGTLSGGQQQILELAIALLLHPRLLMVDEPSLGLDPRMVEIVFDALLAINRDGTTILMVEQNAKKALSVSHRGFVLELGRNRFEGTGRELLENADVRLHYLGG